MRCLNVEALPLAVRSEHFHGEYAWTVGLSEAL
jgi:hypothetical protein